MRITTLLKKLLNVIQLLVTSVEFTDKGLVIDVRPRWRKPRCGKCGRRAPIYDHRPPRLWRHLSQGSTRQWLRYAPRRTQCKTCGVICEQVPWAHPGSMFTADFEEYCAYLAQTTDKTSVTRLLGIDWRTVGAIVHRVVSRKLDPQTDGRCPTGSPVAHPTDRSPPLPLRAPRPRSAGETGPSLQ